MDKTQNTVIKQSKLQTFELRDDILKKFIRGLN